MARELQELESERISILAHLDMRQQQLEAGFLEAREAAESRERLLLTAQGDDLVSIVHECLSDMGFSVVNMDNVYPAKDRREDLQLTAPEMPDWLALVEVRGYRRGAQVNDLMRLERFRTRYLRDKGSEPRAIWYVVNQFLQDDPSTRPPILLGNDPELGTLGEGGGLAIDTADLFRLWMAIQDGRLKAEDARFQLMEARGRFMSH